jgi:hypothetical protein
MEIKENKEERGKGGSDAGRKGNMKSPKEGRKPSR